MLTELIRSVYLLHVESFSISVHLPCAGVREKAMANYALLHHDTHLMYPHIVSVQTIKRSFLD